MQNNNKLYHFTTVENAINIVKTKHLWMTNAANHEFNIQYEIYPFIINIYELHKENNHSIIDRIIEAMNKSKINIDKNSKTWIYDFCHHLIKFRYSSYIICFTDNEKYSNNNKNVILEFDRETFKVAPNALLISNAKRQPLLTLGKVYYGCENLLEIFSNILATQQQVRDQKNTDTKLNQCEILIDDANVLLRLASATDLFKELSFSPESEERLLLYNCDETDLKNIPSCLNTSTNVSKRISWNEDKKLPQLKIYESKNGSNLLNRIICLHVDDAIKIKQSNPEFDEIYIKDAKTGNLNKY